MSSVEVTSLHIYPVKSCAGIDLSSADISPKGFEHDRNWMIVDPQGTKITQRECPEMVSIKPELRGGALELHADGIESLHIELNPLYLSPREVDIWGHRCVALDEGNRAARWISEVLKNDLRIVRFILNTQD